MLDVSRLWRPWKSLSYQPAWDPASILDDEGEPAPAGYSRTSACDCPPVERGVLEAPALHIAHTPNEAWPDTTHWLSREICPAPGQWCQQMNRRTRANGVQTGPGAGDSQAVFQAFRANMAQSSTTGQNNACICGRRGPECTTHEGPAPGITAANVRGLLPENHDETCRFTDGEKIMHIPSVPGERSAGGDDHGLKPRRNGRNWRSRDKERGKGRGPEYSPPGHGGDSLVLVGKREILRDRHDHGLPRPPGHRPRRVRALGGGPVARREEKNEMDAETKDAP